MPLEGEGMSSLGEEIKDWIVSIAIAVVLALGIRYFIVELYLVDGPSMRPTLQSAERLVVNKFIYRFRAPERGEILVFRYPRDPSRDFIKRVIAVPGDTIEIKDGRVYVNSTILNEPYILSKTRGDYPLATVPEGHIFVMGDNRNNSEDSRFADVDLSRMN
jgi:signal peptidase I